jgi:hypothetical protein
MHVADSDRVREVKRWVEKICELEKSTAVKADEWNVQHLAKGAALVEKQQAGQERVPDGSDVQIKEGSTGAKEAEGEGPEHKDEGKYEKRFRKDRLSARRAYRDALGLSRDAETVSPLLSCYSTSFNYYRQGRTFYPQPCMCTLHRTKRTVHRRYSVHVRRLHHSQAWVHDRPGSHRGGSSNSATQEHPDGSRDERRRKCHSPSRPPAQGPISKTRHNEIEGETNEIDGSGPDGSGPDGSGPDGRTR